MKLKLFVANEIQTNCWVLIDEDSKEAIIIDLGGEYEKVLDYIKNEGATPKFILCTHGHFDHIMGIAQMQNSGINIPVYLNEKDSFMTSKINEMLSMFGIHGNYPPVKISGFIDENSKLQIGKYNIKIIETPGHTEGGLCFLVDKYLFSGDTLFYREIGRCDLPGGNYKTMINSLKTKLAVLDDNIEVFPGHGCATNMKDEKAFNQYFK